MTAAEKILSGIIEDAEAKSRIIIDNAKKKAEEIQLEMEKNAKIDADDIISKSEKLRNISNGNADSSAKLLKRNKLLEVKNQIIEDVFSKIEEKINLYDDEKYCEFIYSLAQKNSLDGKGVLKLNQKDLTRNLDSLKSKLSVLNIEVDNEPCEISGGFLLVYGEIIINCSVQALLREKREEITDKINSILFK